MSRPCSARVRVGCVLEATSPLHVGGASGHDDDAIDLRVAVDGTGQPAVPGTSMAGVLRDWCQRHVVDSFRLADRGDTVDLLFGHLPAHPETPRSGGRDDAPPSSDALDEGHASHLIVHDAPVTLPDGTRPVARTSVQIARDTGTAQPEGLFTRQLLPPGSQMRVDLVLEEPPGDPRPRKLLLALLDWMDTSGNELVLGAAGATGLGRVRLVEYEVTELRLDRPDDLVARLRGQGPRQIDVAAELRDGAEALLRDPARLSIDVAFAALQPVFTRGADAADYDTVPLVETSGHDGNLALTLPGSSIRGALRTHAERLVRTVHDLDVADGAHHQQVDVPLVSSLFGSARPLDDGTEQAGRAGVLTVHEVRAAPGSPGHLSPQRWQAVRHGATDQHWKPMTHNAIDRWTGGVAGSLLYDVLDPHAIEFEPLRLEVDLESLDEQVAWAAVGLLFLVLRDVESGRLPLGALTNRGRGAIEIRSINVHGPGDADLPARPRSAVPVPAAWQLQPRTIWDVAAHAWTSWASDATPQDRP